MTLEHLLSDEPAAELTNALPQARSLEPAPPTTAEIRTWARQQGFDIAAKGRIRPEITDEYRDAHAPRPPQRQLGAPSPARP